jgi:hypothetical protein
MTVLACVVKWLKTSPTSRHVPAPWLGGQGVGAYPHLPSVLPSLLCSLHVGVVVQTTSDHMTTLRYTLPWSVGQAGCQLYSEGHFTIPASIVGPRAVRVVRHSCAELQVMLCRRCIVGFGDAAGAVCGTATVWHIYCGAGPQIPDIGLLFGVWFRCMGTPPAPAPTPSLRWRAATGMAHWRKGLH